MIKLKKDTQTMNEHKKEVLTSIRDVRKKLLQMRFLKSQKKGFSSHEYRKNRKILAQLLTKRNNK